jgi:hypothetical protein
MKKTTKRKARAKAKNARSSVRRIKGKDRPLEPRDDEEFYRNLRRIRLDAPHPQTSIDRLPHIAREVSVDDDALRAQPKP